MASLALHGVAYAAERIPDKVFHSVPGGYFKPDERENSHHHRSHRHSHRDHSRHRSSRDRSRSRVSNASTDRHYDGDDDQKSSREKMSRHSDSENEERRRRRRQQRRRRASEEDPNRFNGPLDEAERGQHHDSNGAYPQQWYPAPNGIPYPPYNPADYSGVPADGRTEQFYHPPHHTAPSGHDDSASPVSPTTDHFGRPESTASDPTHFVPPPIDPLFPNKPRSQSYDPVFPTQNGTTAYGAPLHASHSPIMNGVPNGVPRNVPSGVPNGKPNVAPNGAQYDPTTGQAYSPVGGYSPFSQTSRGHPPQMQGRYTPMPNGYPPQAPYSPVVSYGGAPPPHQMPHAHPQQYPPGIYNPALAAGYANAKYSRRSSLRHQVDNSSSRSPSRSRSRSRSRSERRSRNSSKSHSPASDRRKNRSSSRGRRDSKQDDSQKESSSKKDSSKKDSNKKESLRERSRSRAREAQKRIIDHKVHGAHVLGALAGGLAGTAAGPLGTLAGIAAGGFGAHALEKKRRQSIAKRRQPADENGKES